MKLKNDLNTKNGNWNNPIPVLNIVKNYQFYSYIILIWHLYYFND